MKPHGGTIKDVDTVKRIRLANYTRNTHVLGQQKALIYGIKFSKHNIRRILDIARET